MLKITIYTKENCKWCVKAKEILSEYPQYEIVEIPCSEGTEKKKSYPQIYLGTFHLGGCQQLMEYHQEGLIVDHTFG